MTTVKELKAHIDAQCASLKTDLDANKDKVEKRLMEKEPVFEAPPPGAMAAGDFSSGVGQVGGDIIGGVGSVVGGVASTGADAIGAVGNIADNVHNNIDNFFHNIRVRLGI